jgi:hypothetical protein
MLVLLFTTFFCGALSAKSITIAAGAFAAAIAMHLYSVSVAMNAVYIRERSREAREWNRDCEYLVVSCGHGAFVGAMLIFIGFAMAEWTPYWRFLYCGGAISAWVGLWYYAVRLRDWPRWLQRLEGSSEDRG